MSQITHFCGVQLLAWKSGCVKFWTNIMSVWMLRQLRELLHCLASSRSPVPIYFSYISHIFLIYFLYISHVFLIYISYISRIFLIYFSHISHIFFTCFLHISHTFLIYFWYWCLGNWENCCIAWPSNSPPPHMESWAKWQVTARCQYAMLCYVYLWDSFLYTLIAQAAFALLWSLPFSTSLGSLSWSQRGQRGAWLPTQGYWYQGEFRSNVN